jgi:hypothetical protein
MNFEQKFPNIAAMVSACTHDYVLATAHPPTWHCRHCGRTITAPDSKEVWDRIESAARSHERDYAFREAARSN